MARKPVNFHDNSQLVNKFYDVHFSKVYSRTKRRGFHELNYERKVYYCSRTFGYTKNNNDGGGVLFGLDDAL
jgi:hypothetical protein